MCSRTGRTGSAPIGVFDSGVGGLTVMREIARQLPGEDIVYFGDTARVPYGNKSKKNIIRFSRQIIRFLLTKQVKAIVIACNTASALAMDTVKAEFDVPIMGVVEPGARAAVTATRNGRIGVIGTEGTIKSGSYGRAIHQLDPGIQVVPRACPLFVPLVEEGFIGHGVTDEVIAHYLSSLKDSGIDSLILGCTHYPLLQEQIQRFMGRQIAIVNPAYEAACDLKALLYGHDAPGEERTRGHGGVPRTGRDQEDRCDHAGTGETPSAQGHYDFFVSDGAEKFRRFANTVMPFDVPKTNVVNIEEF